MLVNVLQGMNVDGLLPTLDCCKALNVSIDRSTSVVPYTPPSKSAPPDSVCTDIFLDDTTSAQCYVLEHYKLCHTIYISYIHNDVLTNNRILDSFD